MSDSTPVRRSTRRRGQVDWLVLPVALLGATWIASSTWERVRTKPQQHSIQVTGSATRRITSDLIQWSASIEVQSPDRRAAYRQLHEHVDQTVAFLEKAGISREDIGISSVSVQQLQELEVVGTGEDRIERYVVTGYQLQQWVNVSSANVDTVAQASREVTALLEHGISISSSAPQYHYTKLGDLKVEMLAEAAKDARARAQNIIEAAGGELGELLDADMGVININPPNSRSSSWDGNNDTSTVDKDIITVVHATFELDD
ncbi:SIMPL domain-containing protein [Paraliomyxa miuraensis]|uniref:SIMPL domain-containing protein n=1 Tax=Paraliomyxa miuraensis TaxID=376150 RepID=UPI002253B2E1|nr:SIMPL domain-containing protein [Paraliomyxa miuraensis]MCX4246774.1 SIMPL domain-containing protein [Paraliomyxa miuraensis]